MNFRFLTSSRSVLSAAILLLLLWPPSPASAQMAQGWTVTAIGGANDSGAAQIACTSATTSCLGFSLTSRSADIWGSSDAFTFVYRPLAGDGSVIARVDSLLNVNAWAKVGVMIRRSLSPTSENGFTLISAERGAALQARTSDGATTLSAAGAAIAAPGWVRLDRRGSSVTAYDSLDGVNWHQIISGTVPLDPIAYVGIAVTSHDATRTTTANVSNVSVVPAPLPAPWATAAVGAATLPGEASPVGSSLTASSGGTDIYGTSDQFRYIYQRASGDLDLYTRVSSLNAPNEWSKAGVMIRGSLSADSAHAFMLVSGARGLAFQRRPANGYSTNSSSGGAGGASVWVKLEKRGTTITAYRSDGVTWTLVGSETVDLPSTFYVGLAVTSHDTAIPATAVFDGTSIQLRGTAANTPPSVSFTSPAPLATYSPTQSVALTVNATDPDGSVSRVDFFVDGNLYLTDTTAPYATNWQPTSTGSHTFSAVARDNDGATSTTNVTVQVATSQTNAAPLVAITAPVSGASVGPAPATVGLSATASDADGTVARVSFYVGSTLIGSDTSAPYTLSWSGVAAGTYSLTAVATDNTGATTTSAPVALTVTGTQTQTTATAVFVPSTDNANVDYYVVELYTSTGAMVSTVNIGKPAVVSGECRADISAAVRSLAAGSYTARVRAVNSYGGTASAPASFTR